MMYIWQLFLIKALSIYLKGVSDELVSFAHLFAYVNIAAYIHIPVLPESCILFTCISCFIL